MTKSEIANKAWQPPDAPGIPSPLWGEGQNEGGFCDTLILTLSLKGEGMPAFQSAGGLPRFAGCIPNCRTLRGAERRGNPPRPPAFPAGGLLRYARNIRNCFGFLLTLVIALVLFPSLPGYAQTVTGLQCGSFQQVGKFASPEIKECSGLVVSRKNPGVLWVHNDSGDRARLFAVQQDGSLRGIFRLARANSRDWEDLALGPCGDPDKECLYVGDIGDNQQLRRKIQIYRVEEPTVSLDGPPVRKKLQGTERFDCIYPDGPHDAEALFVDPIAGIPYLVTKEQEGSPASVYRFPGTRDLGKLVTLEKVATLPSRSYVTGGDIAQDGSMILLRDYWCAYGYFRPQGGGISEAFDVPPHRVPLGIEQQGESLGLAPSGTEIYTASEGLEGAILKAECTPARAHRTAPRAAARCENDIEQRP